MIKSPFKGDMPRDASPFFTIEQPETSSFLGIFEGKRKTKIIAAKAERERLKAEESRKTLSAQVEAEKAGYKSPEVKQAEAEAATAVIESKSSSTLYMVIAAIVVVVMAGLYFIKRK